jgi:hypothetical protein
MKKFLLKILLFCGITCLLLSAMTHVTDKGLKQSCHHFFQTWNGIFSGSINADVIIQGTSQAWCGIDPAILDTTLHTNSYNLGNNGYQFDMQYVRYRCYRAYNKKPKAIIQCLNFASLGISTGLFEKAQFLPYLGDSILWRGTHALGMPEEFHYLPFLKWEGQRNFMMMGMQRYFGMPNKADAASTYKGFQRRFLQWDGALFRNFTQTHTYVAPIVDNGVFEQFKTFLAQCQQDSIKVFLVNMPMYNAYNRYVILNSQFKQLLQLAAAKYGATVLDYTADKICADTNNFYDPVHLNAAGANAFSEKLAADVRKLDGSLFLP